MEELFLVGGAIVLGILLLSWRILKMKIIVVPEDARLIIYRLGRLHRLAGPGMTYICGRIEQVERVLDARNRPYEFTMRNLRAFGLPFGYTVRLWYRVDPMLVAADDRALMHRLALMRDAERFEEIKAGLHQALMRGLAEFERRYASTAAYSASQRLFALAPDQPGARLVLNEILPELPALLQAQGAILTAEQPVTLKQIHLVYRETTETQEVVAVPVAAVDTEPARHEEMDEHLLDGAPMHRNYALGHEMPVVA